MISVKSGRTLELLAPAKNLECGIAAIDHGADAVYIGADRFGARAAAGNSVADIARLCDYAHMFGAKVHVTLNTIVYDNEIDDTVKLAQEVADAGADALLVQDMGLAERLRKECPGIVLHASTQCDTRSAEKAKWLYDNGFSRVVLARELSVDEIEEISRKCPEQELEVFVHGALCVSFSGVCYASQYCFGRSANRGECAQFCRMAYDLTDSEGKTIEHNRYLISLKDMCQINNLKRLADAGATAFKIEGRLKDVDYVKNVVAAYSLELDRIVEASNGMYRRASRGHCSYSFTPDLRRTFNRGYTTYFADGRRGRMATMLTPKSIGEPVGEVKEIRHGAFSVAGTARLTNGDGLCFFNARGELEGFRVNRVEANGRVIPHPMPKSLRQGMQLYRNYSMEMDRTLAGKSAERKMTVNMRLDAEKDGFSLSLMSMSTVYVHIDYPHEKAQKPQKNNIIRQLSKLGDTPYTAGTIDTVDEYFIPSSLIAAARREGIEKLLKVEAERGNGTNDCVRENDGTKLPKETDEYSRFPYLYNIANRAARDFYASRGMENPQQAFELNRGAYPEDLIMQCRYCLRYELGFCVRRGGRKPEWKEPLFLVDRQGKKFRLEFNCKECQMNIYGQG